MANKSMGHWALPSSFVVIVCIRQILVQDILDMRSLITFFMLSFAVASCSDSNTSSLLEEKDSNPPSKPNDFPTTATTIKEATFKFITEHGNKYCKDMQKLSSKLDIERARLDDKVVALVDSELKLSRKICKLNEQKEFIFAGYTKEDGLLSSTELFIANQNSLRNAIVGAFNAARAMKSNADMFSFQSTLNIYDQDMTLFANPILKKIDEELSSDVDNMKKASAFRVWSGQQLNQWYRENKV